MNTEINYESMTKKQQHLIDSALELFPAHGVKRVTIEEICKNANVSKMTYYKYFDNKYDIAKTVLDVLFTEGIRQYHRMIEQDLPFARKLEMIMTLTTTQVHAVGETFMNELLDPESPLHEYFMKRQKETRELSVDFFKKAQEQGDISASVELQVLLFMLDRNIELVNHPDFIAIMPNIEDRAGELATLFFHGFARTATK